MSQNAWHRVSAPGVVTLLGDARVGRGRERGRGRGWRCIQGARCGARAIGARRGRWRRREREREREVHERRWRIIVCVRLIARAQTRGDGERARRTRREALEV